MPIYDVMKQNELELANIDFKIKPFERKNCHCFYHFAKPSTGCVSGINKWIFGGCSVKMWHFKMPNITKQKK